MKTWKEFIKRRADLWLTLALFGGSFALYVRTLAPSVVTIFDDSLEFQLVCPTLGIAHPTGYPLYTLLGKLFTFIPAGDVAYRVNLMSAVFAALTVALIHPIARLLTNHRLAALLAATSLALSPVFWSQATIAEVYTLNSTFLALMLCLSIAASSKQQVTDTFPLPLISFVYGLSLTHHRSMLFLLPAIALYIWLLDRGFYKSLFRHFRLLARVVGGCLLPLLLYLYIPLRGLSTTSLDGTYRNTLAGFVHQVTASGYGIFISGNPLQQSRPLAFYLGLFGDQFGWIGLGLGLVGALALLFRRPRAMALLGTAFVVYTAFGLVYRVADIEVFFIPSFLIYALWIGEGLALPARWLAEKRRHVLAALVAGVLALGFVLALWPTFGRHLATLDRRQDWEVHDYGRDMLSQPLKEGAKEGATVIGILGEMTLLRYFQQTAGLHPEIVTIAADQEEERLTVITETLAAGRAVYLTRPLSGLAELYSLSALGPLIAVQDSPRTTAPVPDHPLALDVTDNLRLWGYDLALISPHWRTTVRLTLHWQVIAPVEADYKISARLYSSGDDGEGHLVGQTDAIPVHNSYPTSAWRGGEYLADVYDLALLPGTPPGSYRLLVILYRPADGTEVARADLGAIDLPGAPVLPPDKALDVERTVKIDFGSQVRLVGYDAPPEGTTLKPGDALPLTLLWEALTLPGDGLTQALWLQAESGEIVGQVEQPISVPEAGQVVRAWPGLIVPANASDGSYQIRLQVRRGEHPLGARRGLLPQGQPLVLGTVQVQGRERLFEVPAVERPLEVQLGENVKLLGYDLQPVVARPGERLHLTLYWQALQEMDTSYTVFVHLLDGDNRIQGQRDSLPGGGTLPPAQGQAALLPTTGWASGEVIVDPYEIAVDPAAPPGQYTIALGMYNAETGERLPVSGPQISGDHVSLAGVEIKK